MMPEDKDPFARNTDSPAPWTFEGNRALQIRMGLEMTPAERLRWLEASVEELLPWVGRARLGRPVKSSSTS
jgi:hypothetical protein